MCGAWTIRPLMNCQPYISTLTIRPATIGPLWQYIPETFLHLCDASRYFFFVHYCFRWTYCHIHDIHPLLPSPWYGCPACYEAKKMLTFCHMIFWTHLSDWLVSKSVHFVTWLKKILLWCPTNQAKCGCFVIWFLDTLIMNNWLFNPFHLNKNVLGLS